MKHPLRGAASLVIFCGLSLTACSPPVPESGPAADTEIRNLEQERQIRDAALTGIPIEIRSTTTPGSGAQPLTAVQNAQSGANAQTAPGSLVATDLGAPLSAINNESSGTSSGSTFPVDRSKISDENSFDAVSSRQTIESDANRLERNRSAYVVVEPGDLPVRPGELGPNIVDYAIRTTNPKGTQLYSRFGFTTEKRAAQNCAAYTSPDQAQIDFLARGGPKRDRLGLDPDGDGFACAWDPTPFRAALTPQTSGTNDL